jgi:hypothetical protein
LLALTGPAGRKSGCFPGGSWLVPGSRSGREIPLLLGFIAFVQFLLGDGRYVVSKSALLRWCRGQQAQPA